MDQITIERIVIDFGHGLFDSLCDAFSDCNNRYDIGSKIYREKELNRSFVFTRFANVNPSGKNLTIIEHYDLYPGDIILSLGCCTYPVDFWKIHYKEMCKSYGMEDSDIEIYKYIINVYDNFEKISRKYFK